MAPRETETTETSPTTGTAERSGGFIGSGGAAGGPADKLIGQVRDQVGTLKGQATDKLRNLAVDGKDRAATLLDDVAGVIADAARSIDQRLGKDYSDYAERASEAVSGFADRVRDKSVDDLVDDTRNVVRKSPALAIAAAAIVGFALVRVLRTGIEEASGTRRRTSGSGRGARRSGGGEA